VLDGGQVERHAQGEQHLVDPPADVDVDAERGEGAGHHGDAPGSTLDVDAQAVPLHVPMEPDACGGTVTPRRTAREHDAGRRVPSVSTGWRPGP
jgi:hypothetical protein